MKSNLNFLFAVLIVVAIVSLALVLRGCSTPRVPEFIDPMLTFDEAMVRSAETGKPVFALVSADWCAYCKSLKRNALSSSRVVSFIKENTIPVYLDATKSNDTDVLAMMSRMRVEGLPAMILLKRGQQFGHLEGEVPAKELLQWLEQGKKEADSPAQPNPT